MSDENQPNEGLQSDPSVNNELNNNPTNPKAPSDYNPSSRGTNHSLNTNPNPGQPSSGRRSIRDLTRDSNENKKNDGKPAFADSRKFSSRHYKTAGKGKLLGAVGVAVALIIGFFAVGNLTHTANLEISTATFALSSSEDIALSDLSGYDIQNISVSLTEIVPADRVEEVRVPAEGVITVYNTSNESQRLIPNTRFRSANGVEYMTPVAITVPAASGSQPGVLENVEVIAKIDGVNYSVSDTNQTVSGNLSVPGLDGTDLEGEVYAVATSSFAGGFEGDRGVASETDLAEAESNLEDELTSSFESLAKAQLGQNSIYLDRIGDLEFSTNQNSSNESNNEVEVEVVARAEVVTIDQSALLEALASQSNTSVEVTDGLTILNQGNLEFEVEEVSDEELVFNLDNTVNASYVMDVEALKEAIAGLSSSEIEEAFDADPAIESYNLEISPFWKSSLPTNPAKIEIAVEDGDRTTGRSPVTNADDAEVDVNTEDVGTTGEENIDPDDETEDPEETSEVETVRTEI